MLKRKFQNPFRLGSIARPSQGLDICRRLPLKPSQPPNAHLHWGLTGICTIIANAFCTRCMSYCQSALWWGAQCICLNLGLQSLPPACCAAISKPPQLSTSGHAPLPRRLGSDLMIGGVRCGIPWGINIHCALLTYLGLYHTMVDDIMEHALYDPCQIYPWTLFNPTILFGPNNHAWDEKTIGGWGGGAIVRPSWWT